MFHPPWRASLMKNDLLRGHPLPTPTSHSFSDLHYHWFLMWHNWLQVWGSKIFTLITWLLSEYEKYASKAIRRLPCFDSAVFLLLNLQRKNPFYKHDSWLYSVLIQLEFNFDDGVTKCSVFRSVCWKILKCTAAQTWLTKRIFKQKQKSAPHEITPALKL